MRKKCILLFLCLLLLVALLPAQSACADANALPLVIDGAHLLDTSQEQSLESMARTLREKYSMDVVILTVNSLDGKRPQNYADDYYDANGYGVGENHSGVLFLLAMEDRDWYISTCGDAIYALTDYGIQQVGEAALPYLSQANYYTAFSTYLRTLETYLAAYAKGTPIDGYANYSGSYYHGDQEGVIYYEPETPFSVTVLISVVVGALVSIVSILCMRAGMNTKRSQRSASDYMTRDSFRLRTKQDLFLYSRVTKTRRESSSGSGHSGGGSSVHHSSGGHSHGGGGGKF